MTGPEESTDDAPADDGRDHVDRMLDAWAAVEPGLDASPLAVAGRLLLGAALLERAIDAALRPLTISFGDFDVLNTLRRRADPGGTHPRLLSHSALITSGAMTTRLDRLERRPARRATPRPGGRAGEAGPPDAGRGGEGAGRARRRPRRRPGLPGPPRRRRPGRRRRRPATPPPRRRHRRPLTRPSPPPWPACAAAAGRCGGLRHGRRRTAARPVRTDRPGGP